MTTKWRYEPETKTIRSQPGKDSMNAQQNSTRFPVGGERDKVYSFLRSNGYIMSDWSDKHWTRADGVNLHLYSSGSRARITKSGQVIADDALDIAVINAK
jgi:hypothetical protein